jgi:hypothetical protein
MGIKNTLASGTDWTEEKLTPTDVNDTMDEMSRINLFLFQNTLNDLRENTAPSGDTKRYPSLFYDVLTDKTKIDVETNTEYYTQTDEGFVGIAIQQTTPDISADFTGGAIDAAFAHFTTGTGGASTFDAGNDEVDLTAEHNTPGGTGGMRYSTNVEFGVTIIKITNIVFNTLSSVVTKFKLTWGGGSIYYQATGTGGGSGTKKIVNDNSDEVSLSPGATVTFKIERNGGRVRTYYDNAGGTTFTQLGSERETSNFGGAKPQVDASLGSSGAAGTATCSVSFFDIYNTYESTGNFTTTTTAVASAEVFEAEFVDGVTPTNTTIASAISHDNGSNYDTISLSNFSGRGKITTAGTTLKKKYTLSTTDTTTTPEVYGWINRYT